jgi:putative ABC transport system ATP-binding protein
LPFLPIDSIIISDEVVNLMQKLAKEHNSTILLVTHDSRILDIADRVINMEDGRLV